MDKRVLVTGASGVIGTHLILDLQGQDISVDANYLTGMPLDIIDDEHKLKFDITDIDAIKALPMYDEIYHLAGYGQPSKFTANPKKTLELNTRSLEALVDKVVPGGKFMFMSTSEVYAANSMAQGTKETSPLTIVPGNSRNSYILGKLGGEEYLNHIDDKHTYAIRICLAYGSLFKPDDGRVMYEFARKMLKDKHIHLKDAGSARRRYIFIDDAIQMLNNIMAHGEHKVYNVGGKEETTILDIALLIGNTTGKPHSVTWEGSNLGADWLPDSPQFAGVDISRYEAEFGQVDFTSLKDGIEVVVGWQEVINNGWREF